MNVLSVATTDPHFTPSIITEGRDLTDLTDLLHIFIYSQKKDEAKFPRLNFRGDGEFFLSKYNLIFNDLPVVRRNR